MPQIQTMTLDKKFAISNKACYYRINLTEIIPPSKFLSKYKTVFFDNCVVHNGTF
jgi:hypothetical protein